MAKNVSMYGYTAADRSLSSQSACAAAHAARLSGDRSRPICSVTFIAASAPLLTAQPAYGTCPNQSSSDTPPTVHSHASPIFAISTRYSPPFSSATTA